MISATRACALWLALTAPAMLTAGQSVDVSVTGSVVDATAAVLPGVTIAARNQATGVVRIAVSDADGRYVLPPLPPGHYEIAADLSGFRPQQRTTELHVGTTIVIDFTLDTLTAAQRVEVVGEAPALETTKNALTRLVVREEIDALPVADRNFNSLAAMVPGVTPTGAYGGVDISGSRDFQNGYNVDGLSAEGLSLGEQRVGLAQDWIEEFQVLSSQYGVEFGKASGGIINAITRSGSNRTSGRAYGFFRDDAWDATPAFTRRKPPLAARRLGATAGGKIVADRLFYFAGIERYATDSSNIVNSSFPSENGTVPFSDRSTVFVAKAEHHPNAANAYRVRANGDLREATGAGIGGIFTEEHGRSTQGRAGDLGGSWTSVLGASTFNELRAAISVSSNDSQCNFAAQQPLGSRFERRYPGAWLGCPISYGRTDFDELQLIDNATWATGDHHFKAGFQLSRAGSGGDFRNNRDGNYRFVEDVPFDISRPETYPFFFSIFIGPTIWDYTWWSWGAFVQDSWRVHPQLTINAGVRYDLDGAYSALNPGVRIERGMHPFARDIDNVAPRLGLAWTPFEQTSTVVRGGAGRYVDQNPGNVAFLLLHNNILLDRSFNLNAFTPGLNPFAPDVERARRFLAEALARNSVPDITGLPGGAGVASDVEEGLQIPYTLQVSGGAIHTFGRLGHVSADVVYSRGFDQYIVRDVNIDRDAALASNLIVRPNPNYTSINQYGNGGRFSYRALQLQASITPNAAHFARLSYTLAKNTSNTNTLLGGIGGGAGATNPFDFGEDLGPADNDVRHALSANGATTFPLDVQLSAILTVQSALPYSVTSPLQLDRDPFPDRPEARNSRRGDQFVSLDVRLTKRVRVGPTALEVFAEMFNTANATNLTGYVGMLNSSLFGQASAARDRRRTQLGLRFSF